MSIASDASFPGLSSLPLEFPDDFFMQEPIKPKSTCTADTKLAKGRRGEGVNDDEYVAKADDELLQYTAHAWVQHADYDAYPLSYRRLLASMIECVKSESEKFPTYEQAVDFIAGFFTVADEDLAKSKEENEIRMPSPHDSFPDMSSLPDHFPSDFSAPGAMGSRRVQVTTLSPAVSAPVDAEEYEKEEMADAETYTVRIDDDLIKLTAQAWVMHPAYVVHPKSYQRLLLKMVERTKHLEGLSDCDTNEHDIADYFESAYNDACSEEEMFVDDEADEFEEDKKSPSESDEEADELEGHAENCSDVENAKNDPNISSGPSAYNDACSEEEMFVDDEADEFEEDKKSPSESDEEADELEGHAENCSDVENAKNDPNISSGPSAPKPMSKKAEVVEVTGLSSSPDPPSPARLTAQQKGKQKEKQPESAVTPKIQKKQAGPSKLPSKPPLDIAKKKQVEDMKASINIMDSWMKGNVGTSGRKVGFFADQPPVKAPTKKNEGLKNPSENGGGSDSDIEIIEVKEVNRGLFNKAKHTTSTVKEKQNKKRERDVPREVTPSPKEPPRKRIQSLRYMEKQNKKRERDVPRELTPSPEEPPRKRIQKQNKKRERDVPREFTPSPEEPPRKRIQSLGYMVRKETPREEVPTSPDEPLQNLMRKNARKEVHASLLQSPIQPPQRRVEQRPAAMVPDLNIGGANDNDVDKTDRASTPITEYDPEIHGVYLSDPDNSDEEPPAETSIELLQQILSATRKTAKYAKRTARDTKAMATAIKETLPKISRAINENGEYTEDVNRTLETMNGNLEHFLMVGKTRG